MQVVERLSFILTVFFLTLFSLPSPSLAGHIPRSSCKARRIPPAPEASLVASPSTSAAAGKPTNVAASPAAKSPSGSGSGSGSCYPGLGFQTPSTLPSDNSQWWCKEEDEYAFLGFSYEVSECQSLSKLQSEFKDIRTRFNGRYVRLYGACDRKGFYDDVITAAYDNTLGVHALIWFGFDGGNIWKTRRDSLFSTLHSNPKAPFVTRVVQFGSEPLFDSVLSPSELANQVTSAKAELSSLNIPVTVSDMAYGYQSNGGAQSVLDAIDSIDAHMLPFFSTKASTGSAAWPIVMTDLQWFIDHGKGKKIYFSENGWPSVSYDGVEPNSKAAVASKSSEQQYFELLDSKCSFFKTVPGGGVGWFAHIYSDEQEPGYGILDDSGKLKFPFSPKTSC